ncbi:MAG: O-antigen ligase family protein [Phycisphaerae bacterium]|nr:O-antigen ligase family protein [Phycisphaerae bacterium]
MIQPDIYASPYALSGDWEAPTPACKKLIGCLWVSAIASLPAGIMYLFLKDPVIPALLVGTVVVLLTLYHTPFGLFVLFTLFALENAVVLSPQFSLSKAMGIIVAASFLLHAFSERLIVTAPLKLAAVLIAWALASSLWSMMPFYTALVCVTFVLNATLILIVLNSVKDARSLYAVLGGFILGAFLASCMVVAQFQQPLRQSAVIREGLHEETNPLVLAMAIGMGFMATSFTFFRKGTLKKIIAVALLGLLFIAMVRTQSRMPTVAAISAPVIALILVSKSQHRFKYLMIAIVGGLVAYFAVRMVLSSGLFLSAAEKERVFSQGFEESGRLAFWKMGLQAFLRRPLHGYGANNFEMIPGNPTGRSAHNNVVSLAVDLGLVGLGLAAAIFLALYRQVRSLSDIRLKWLGLTMLLYPLMTGITVTNYIKREFWYSLAIAMAAVAIGKRQEERSSGQLWYGYTGVRAGPGY